MAVQFEVRELIPCPSGGWKPFGESRPQPMPVRTPVEFGRVTGVGIGRRPLDRKVSGTAVEVTVDGDLWDVEATNRHGVVLHPWGLAPRPLRGGERTTTAWLRVGLYVRGDDLAFQHWILLESDAPLRAGIDEAVTNTVSAEKAKELSPSETLIIRTKFEDFLAWPPRYPAQVRTDAECIRRLPWTGKQIRFHLARAREKAGFPGQNGQGPSDPEWVHALVQRGQLTR